MKPDSDISMMFTNYIRKTLTPNCSEDDGMENGVSGARAMLNEAASLFELEEDGFFRFYTLEELKDLLADAGFVEVTGAFFHGRPSSGLHRSCKKDLDNILDYSTIATIPKNSTRNEIKWLE